MTTLKHRASLLARRLGVNVTRYPPPESHERHLADLLRALDVQLVLDVGAHVGEFGQRLRGQCGYRGQIISFEPASRAMTRLREVADDRWRVEQVALGDRSREGLLNLYSASVANSLLTPSDYGREIIDMESLGTEPVLVRALDDVLDTLGVDVSGVPTLLKVDTQGSDLDVLRGAPGTLANVELLQVELPALALYEQTPTMLTMLEFLTSAGFAITGMFPIDRDRLHRVFEFDCVLRRVPGGS